MELRPYQLEAVDSIDKFFLNGYGNPLVVAPTASGKSVMIAEYLDRAFKRFPSTRVMVLAHVKELLEQNYHECLQLAPHIDIGLFSAGLRRKDCTNSAIFAGIQSCYARAVDFGYQDFVIIDECHLVRPKAAGRYREFINDLKKINPALKVIGFTATPYRLGHGWIHKGKDAIFDGISYNIEIDTLIQQEYLVRPVARSGSVHADMSDVHILRGEFVEAEAAAKFKEITLPAVQDALSRAQGRRAGLVFCTGIEHAQDTLKAFNACGESSVAIVTGKTKAEERRNTVEDVKCGRLKWLINVGVFTTGFNATIIDTIVLLRATESTGLYVQMIGRGLRLHPGKKDCLVLDYGENVKRHGTLNFLRIREPGERRNPDSVRAKDCPQCEELVAVNCAVCPLCGFFFPRDPRQPNHGTQAGEYDLIDEVKSKWYTVKEMKVSKHTKMGGRPSMKVAYYVGDAWAVYEYICLDHTGYARSKALKWARERGHEPFNVDSALNIDWPVPLAIEVQRDKNGFDRVVNYRWRDKK